MPLIKAVLSIIIIPRQEYLHNTQPEEEIKHRIWNSGNQEYTICHPESRMLSGLPAASLTSCVLYYYPTFAHKRHLRQQLGLDLGFK